MARLENALTRELSGEQFVTAVLAEIGGGSSITVINCGHPPPMVLDADGDIWFAEPPDDALPLGLGSLGGRASPCRTTSRSSRATRSSSTPTVSSRPATGWARSTRWRSGRTC